MSLLIRINDRLRRIINRRKETMRTIKDTARHNRNPPPKSMIPYVDKHGVKRCGDPECGGEVIDQNGRGNEICFMCGKKAM